MNCLAQRKRFKNKQPAWTDPQDGQQPGGEKASIAEDKQVASDNKSDEDSSDDDDDACDMHASDVRSKNLRLEGKNLHYKHLTNINNERSFNGPVTGVQFHSKSKVALVGLGYGQLDLYEIDGERNRYLQNIKLPKGRSPYCSFTPDGNSVLISCEEYNGKFYHFDMISNEVNMHHMMVGTSSRKMTDFKLNGKLMACRKEGSQEVMLLSSRTFENTHCLKMNEPVRDLQFSSKNELYVAGDNANIYIWDLRKSSVCKHRFKDEGSIHSTRLALTEQSGQISVGNDSGVVNTYDLEQCQSSKYPVPIRTYCNLKTEIDILKYNPAGEIVVFGSRAEPSAIRMAHSHSGTVYRNFPILQRDYGHILDVDFSPLGGYMGFGTSKGRAHLCRVAYYKSY